MTRSEKVFRIEEEIQDWRTRLEKAFLNVVNYKRKAQNLPALLHSTPVYLPKGSNANLYLLTLKVWCLRHCVTPEWLLEKLLWRFKNNRQPDNNPNLIHLGLPATMLIGTVAQNTIQEALAQDFPNNENRKSVSAYSLHEIFAGNLDFSLSTSFDKYTEAIAKERTRLKKADKRTRKRNYRQQY